MAPTKRGTPGSLLARCPISTFILAGLFPLVLFWPVLGGGFLIWDDNVNLIANPTLWESAGKSLRWMFADLESVQRYKPLNWLAWRILGQSFGVNPVVFHALNLTLHAGNSVLLFCAIRKFLTAASPHDGPIPNVTTFATLIGAGWWALHPLRVEPVAWISGAGYPLATFFALLTVLNFQQHLRDGCSRSRWCALLFFILSLLSYPAAAALPALLLALAWLGHSALQLPPRATLWRIFRLLSPYGILAIALLGATLFVRLTTEGEIWNHPASLAVVGPGTRVVQAFSVWCWYLAKTLLPLQLAPVYPDFWDFYPLSFRAIANIAAIIGLSAGAWRIRHRWPEVPILWAAFLLLAVPVLGLTDHPFSPADRYTYVPSLALAFLLSSLLHRSAAAIQRVRIVTLVCVGATLGAYSTATIQQLKVWRTPVAFFNCAIASVGDRPAAANLHWRLGLHQLSAQQNAEAIAEFETVLRLDPHDPDAARYIQVLRVRVQPESEKNPPEKRSDNSP